MISKDTKVIHRKMRHSNFLSALIRTHKRPKALRKCIDSLNRQTERNFIVILISDCKDDKVEKIISEYPDLRFNVKYVEPLGFPACNIYFNKVKNIVDSDYVVFIDDDDDVTDNTYFSALDSISIREKYPGVIISRALSAKGVIPEDTYWKKPPIKTHISTQNFCVRSDIFKKFDWLGIRAGDYHFISTIFNNIDWKKSVYWYDKITMSITNTGYGRPEK